MSDTIMRIFGKDIFLMLLVTVTLLFITWKNAIKREVTVIQDEIKVDSVTIRYLYGLPVDSFILEEGRIRPDQYLGGLLAGYGLGADTVNLILEKAKEHFDPGKIKSGNKYIAFFSPDSLFTLKYFVYEKDAGSYVMFRFGDSPGVYSGLKKIDTLRMELAGCIKSSLWNAIRENGGNPLLANDLSDIYAWTIDFFGLQQGDSFRLVYDEYFSDSLSTGPGKVYGAWFRHMGKEYWAIPFEQDGLTAFYNESGLSLRKAFLKAPLRYSRISSRFSNSRLHPVLKIRRPHHGVDYAAPVGTPVYSVGDGVVTETGNDGESGYKIKIKHNPVYSTAYLHLSRFASGITRGSIVKQGDLIAYVGSTGLSTGPHLDFRFYMNGKPVDPLKVEAPSVEPVKPENMDRFQLCRDSVISMLREF